MHEALFSAAILAVTIGLLFATRSRSAYFRAAVELFLLAAIGAFLLWRGTSPIPRIGDLPVGLAGTWLKTLAVVWWLVGARAAVTATALARGRDPHSREARLFSDLAAGAIYVATVLIILNSVLDLPVNGLLATSGVIAIVLGLALQNTLADVFSGIAVGLEQPFHVGDRISVGTDIEGIVVQMNWRSVRIQTDADDLATVPNSLVAKGQITNRSVPSRRRAATVEITTVANAHSELVLEMMRQAMLLCPNILLYPAPSQTIRRSGLHSSTYAASFFVAETAELTGAKSMLLRQIRRLLRHAGVGAAHAPTVAELLGSLVLFEALPPEDLEPLAEKVGSRIVEPDEIVFQQGDTGSSIYVVRSGVMQIIRSHSDRDETMLGRIGPGEYIGELSFATGEPRPVTMKAITHGCMLEVPADAVRALLDANKALGAAMERSVRRGLALLDRDDAARIAQPVEGNADLFARLRAYFGL